MQLPGGKNAAGRENCNCPEVGSFWGCLSGRGRSVWGEHSEGAGKLAGGEVRGNLFYCY